MSRAADRADPDLLSTASQALESPTNEGAAAAQRRELDMIQTGAWADPDALESTRSRAWTQ